MIPINMGGKNENDRVASPESVPIHINSLTTEKQTTKFSSANFQKMLSPSYIILRIQRLEGKQCRSRWGGSLWATSSRSMLFANSAIFVTGS